MEQHCYGSRPSNTAAPSHAAQLQQLGSQLILSAILVYKHTMDYRHGTRPAGLPAADTDAARHWANEAVLIELTSSECVALDC